MSAEKEGASPQKVDHEKDFETASATTGAEDGLKRQLKNRHVSMISIGGVIGTGLFVGTATALQHGGPLGLFLGYSIMGTICWSVMVSLGEMVALLPVPGGHIKLAERFVNRALSLAMGWNSWYNYTIGIPAEISASAVLFDLWAPNVNNAAWISICLVVVVTINLCGAGVYGECEFIFASIKIITIVGLIILGIVLDLGGGPNRDRIGFRYWKNPGPFVQFENIEGAKGRFLGFCSVLTQAAFSFIGTETVALAAGETKNPRRNMPKAIRRVYIRLVLFYVTGTFIIGLLVPSTEPRLNLGGVSAASPFVIAIQNAGIRGLPSLVNACFLTSAWSAASSDLYTSSRALYGLAAAGNAPKIFLKTLRNGLPIVSIVTCALFSLLAYMGINSGSGRVFGWFGNMTAIAGLVTWFGISVTYLRFYAGLKVQGYDRSTLPYASRFQPFAAWYVLIWTLIICVFSGWTVFLKNKWATDTFVTNYLPMVMFPLLYFGARIYYKQPIRKASEMDFETGVDEDDLYDIPPSNNKLQGFWTWLVE